jgi:hypothetical protein
MNDGGWFEGFVGRGQGAGLLQVLSCAVSTAVDGEAVISTSAVRWFVAEERCLMVDGFLKSLCANGDGEMGR